MFGKIMLVIGIIAVLGFVIGLAYTIGWREGQKDLIDGMRHGDVRVLKLVLNSIYGAGEKKDEYICSKLYGTKPFKPFEKAKFIKEDE